MPPEEVERISELFVQIAADPRKSASTHALVGPFFHLIRNRLNSLQMYLYLGKRGDDGTDALAWEELSALYREAEQVVEKFQAICKPMTISPLPIDVALVLNDVAGRWAERFAVRGIRLNVESSGSHEHEQEQFDPTRWACVLNSVAEWRCEQARPLTQITLRGGMRNGLLFIEWDEFHERQKPAPGTSKMDLAGILPMALLARVASAHGGELLRDTDDGWKFSVQWRPAAISSGDPNRKVPIRVP